MVETEAKPIDGNVFPALKPEEISSEAILKKLKTKFYYLPLILIAMLLIILLFYIFGGTNTVNLPADPAADLKTGRSVAILSFKPVDDESKNNKLGFGMAGAIITRLSKLHKIPVRLGLWF